MSFQTSKPLDKIELVARIQGKNVGVMIEHLESKFRVTRKADGKSTELRDNFDLADAFLEAELDGNARNQVAQLINRLPDGTLRIRFKGT